MKQLLIEGKIFDQQSVESPETSKKRKLLKAKLDHRSRKINHADAYIKYVGELYSDCCPTNSHIRALPYESKRQLYEEYSHFCTTTLKLNFKSFANYETFRKAFNSNQNHIRLVGCKGTLKI